MLLHVNNKIWSEGGEWDHLRKLGINLKEMNSMRMNYHVTPIVKLTKSFYRNEEPRLRSLCFSLSPAKLEVHRKKEWCSTHFFQKFLH